jgi:hypothetical protein
MGKILFLDEAEKVLKGVFTINLETLVSGAYNLVLETSSGKSRYKFIKE